MKTKSMVGLLAVVVAAAACGYEGLRNVERESAAPVEVVTAGQALVLDVRMKAKNVERFRSLLLRATKVEARVGDRVLPGELVADFVELTRQDHAARIARVTVPEGVEEMTVSVTFDDWGAFQGDDASGWVNAKGLTLELEVPLVYATKDKAVLELDLARSLVALDSHALALVPVYRTLF